MTTSRVLVPLDGLTLARSILPAMRPFVDPQRHELILLRVAEPLPGLVDATTEVLDVGRGQSQTFGADVLDLAAGIQAHRVPPAWPLLREQLLAELAPAVEALEAWGYTVSVQVRFGSPAREIIAVTTEMPVALLAMATHGRTGLLDVLMGSVARSVLRHVAVPILLLRPKL